MSLIIVEGLDEIFKCPLQTKLLYDFLECVYAKLPSTAESFCLPTYNAGYSTGLNIIYFSIMKKDNAVILPSGQVSQKVVFPRFLHLPSQLQSELAQDPQAVDTDTLFLLPCQVSTPQLHHIRLQKPRTPKRWGRDGGVPIRAGTSAAVPQEGQRKACPYPCSPQRLRC